MAIPKCVKEPITDVRRVGLADSPKSSEQDRQDYERFAAGICLYWGEDFQFKFIDNGHTHDFVFRDTTKTDKDVYELANKVNASIWHVKSADNMRYRCLCTGRHQERYSTHVDNTDLEN